MSLNKVLVMGRICNDLEIKTTNSGKYVLQFTVAADRSYKGEKKADFLKIVAWEKTAGFIDTYFEKGSMICIEGQLRTREYQDKNYPEVTHYATEIYADHVYFTGEKKQAMENIKSEDLNGVELPF